MIYEKIKPTNFSFIEKFAGVFNFPKNRKMKEFFCENNAGKFTCFSVKIQRENFEEKRMKQLLSFNENDEENIYDAINNVYTDGSNVVPFAVDDEGNYLCYIEKTDAVQYYEMDTMELYPIFDENEKEWATDDFFGEIGV